MSEFSPVAIAEQAVNASELAEDQVAQQQSVELEQEKESGILPPEEWGTNPPGSLGSTILIISIGGVLCVEIIRKQLRN